MSHLQTPHVSVSHIKMVIVPFKPEPLNVPLQTDVTTMELVDLPGIQTFPDDYAKATTALVTKYLNKPDTLVLCVVDATIPSLDSSTALAMIRAADKLPNTILALTKSDLVRSVSNLLLLLACGFSFLLGSF